MGNSHIVSDILLTREMGCLYLVRGSTRAPLWIYNTKSNKNLDKLQQHHHATTTTSTLPIEMTQWGAKSKPRLGLQGDKQGWGGQVMTGHCTTATMAV